MENLAGKSCLWREKNRVHPSCRLVNFRWNWENVEIKHVLSCGEGGKVDRLKVVVVIGWRPRESEGYT